MQANMKISNEDNLLHIRHDLAGAIGVLQSMNYHLGEKIPRVDLAKFFCGELITRLDSLVSRMDEVLAEGAK